MLDLVAPGGSCKQGTFLRRSLCAGRTEGHGERSCHIAFYLLGTLSVDIKNGERPSICLFGFHETACLKVLGQRSGLRQLRLPHPCAQLTSDGRTPAARHEGRLYHVIMVSSPIGWDAGSPPPHYIPSLEKHIARKDRTRWIGLPTKLDGRHCRKTSTIFSSR